jgi:hypothetical protein
LLHTQSPRLQHIPRLPRNAQHSFCRLQQAALLPLPQVNCPDGGGLGHGAALTGRLPTAARPAAANAPAITRKACRRGIGVASTRAMLSMSSSMFVRSLGSIVRLVLACGTYRTVHLTTSQCQSELCPQRKTLV